MTGRLNYERTVTTVAKLNVPTFYTGGSLQATEAMFRVAEGERFGTLLRPQLPDRLLAARSGVRHQCGAGRAFQRNQDGLIVVDGRGNSINDGVTKNLLERQPPAAQAPWGRAGGWGSPDRPARAERLRRGGAGAARPGAADFRTARLDQTSRGVA
jgi:hypothetical protein